MYNQLCDYFDNILFPSQCGFQKGYSTQNCLLVMIKNFKEAIDRGNEFGVLINDLSKTFDCLNHPLVITKMYNDGVSPSYLLTWFSPVWEIDHSKPKLKNASVRDLE